MNDNPMKELIKKTPILGRLARRVYRRIRANRAAPGPFAGSEQYWEERYAAGGDSGVGSHGELAKFKAEIINIFVVQHDLQFVIEFGCGDGSQLRLMNYPSYLGFDVSKTVVSLCRRLFALDGSKEFRLVREYTSEKADLTLSLDVLYHLVEDEVFESHMRTLFDASNRYVIIYSSDSDDNTGYEGTHVRHRKFTEWIQLNLPSWKLSKHVPNKYPFKGDYRTGSIAEFFIYERA